MQCSAVQCRAFYTVPPSHSILSPSHPTDLSLYISSSYLSLSYPTSLRSFSPSLPFFSSSSSSSGGSESEQLRPQHRGHGGQIRHGTWVHVQVSRCPLQTRNTSEAAVMLCSEGRIRAVCTRIVHVLCTYCNVPPITNPIAYTFARAHTQKFTPESQLIIPD